MTQDEPAGGSPDTKPGPKSNQVFLRAERNGNGDGRVYRIAFVASDGKGGTCTGSTVVKVPHDQGKGKPKQKAVKNGKGKPKATR